MLAKLTSKNQLTLPQAVISAFPDIDYFDVAEENGRIVLPRAGDAGGRGAGEAGRARPVGWGRGGRRRWARRKE